MENKQVSFSTQAPQAGAASDQGADTGLLGGKQPTPTVSGVNASRGNRPGRTRGPGAGALLLVLSGIVGGAGVWQASVNAGRRAEIAAAQARLEAQSREAAPETYRSPLLYGEHGEQKKPGQP